MATKRDKDADVWLLEGSGRGSPKPKTPKRPSNGRSPEPRPVGQWSIPKPPSPHEQGASNGQNGRPIGRRWSLAGRHRRAQSQLESYKKRNSELELRAEQLEAKLREERKGGRARVAELRAQLKSDQRRLPKGKLDANTVTFEQLRELGLTVTQTANLIRHRDSRGGFRSSAELDRTPGLSNSARETLKERLRVGRG